MGNILIVCLSSSLAVAYSSPRIVGRREKSFYALLRHAETIETDRITSELHLDHDGKVLKVKREAATIHLLEDDTSLKFYVPQDETRQELCFNATLPENICQWLMTDSTTMIKDPIVPRMVHDAQVILSTKPTAMNGILDHHGIKLAPVPDGEDDDEEEEVEGPQASIEEPESPQSLDEVAVTTQPWASVPRQRVAVFDSDEEETITSRSNTPFSRLVESRGSGTAPGFSFTFTPPTATTATTATTSTTATTTVMDDEELYISSLLARTHISKSSASPVPQVFLLSPQDNSYAVLLDRLVKAVTHASIPSRGNVFMSIMPNTGVQRDNRWFRDATLDEKYKQIGAAGELFVSTRCMCRTRKDQTRRKQKTNLLFSLCLILD